MKKKAKNIQKLFLYSFWKIEKYAKQSVMKSFKVCSALFESRYRNYSELKRIFDVRMRFFFL